MNVPIIKDQTNLLSESLPGFVFPRSLKVLLLGAGPKTLPSRLCPPLRPPISLLQSRTEFNTRLRLVHCRQPQFQHLVSHISPQQPPSHIHSGDRPIKLILSVDVGSHASV